MPEVGAGRPSWQSWSPTTSVPRGRCRPQPERSTANQCESCQEIMKIRNVVVSVVDVGGVGVCGNGVGGVGDCGNGVGSNCKDDSTIR